MLKIVESSKENEESFLEIKQSEIISNFFYWARIYQDSEDLLNVNNSKLENLLIDDTEFKNKNINLIKIIKEAFSGLQLDLIPRLIKIFNIKLFTINEVLNILYSLNSIILHLEHFDNLIKNELYNDRIYNESLTERFMNYHYNKDFIFLLNNYKTRPMIQNNINDQSIDEYNRKIYYKDKTEKRRNLMLDEKGYFNYIPYMCKYKTHTDVDEYCPFSHNENEILYHASTLKIKFCNEINCNKTTCPFAHTFSNDGDKIKDFRELYNKRNPQVIKIIKTCFSYRLFCNKLSGNDPSENASMIISMLPSEFNPDTYKTIECPLGKYCRLDRKLCLNYHDINEKRRKTKNYESTNCKNIFKEGKFVDPRNCLNGDDCKYCHTIYEFMYHRQNFRIRPCAYEQKKGIQCKYLMICPYKHSTDCIDFENKMCYNTRTVKYYTETLKMKIKDKVQKIKGLQTVLDYHSCDYCQGDLKRNYNILKCCDKIICEDCKLEKIAKTDNSRNGKDLNYTCTLCGKTNLINNFKEIKLK